MQSTKILRPAQPADIPGIAAIERLLAARCFVGRWTEEHHRQTMASADARYFVSQTESGELLAFAILRGLAESSRAIELKRIVVATPSQGLGRRIMQELMPMVFEEFGAHRLWLDVCDDNTRARHLYESLGFVYEGVLREAEYRDGEFVSLRLMSLLDREYEARASRSASAAH